MGSSRNSHAQSSAEQLVNVSTGQLKDRLNRIYENLHHKFGSHGRDETSQQRMFEYLWDLKEMALLEGQNSVQLPQNWLEELETESGLVSHRTH